MDLAHIQSLSLGSTGSDGGSDSAGDNTRKGGGGVGREGSGEYDAQNDSDSAIMLEDHLTEVCTKKSLMNSSVEKPCVAIYSF